MTETNGGIAVPDAAVEAAAMAIYAANGFGESGYELADYRQDARVAVAAAAPHLDTSAPQPAREVATIGELDALPVGSVVRECSDAGVVYQKIDRGGVQWYEPGYVVNWESRELRLPATVLYDPSKD